MPWGIEDVDEHKAGLTDKQKEIWVKVANGALARCKEGGQGDCEARAIKQANSVAGRIGESFEDWYEKLDPDTLALLEGHTLGLKTALAKERAARKDAEKKLAEQNLAEGDLLGDVIPLVEKAIGKDGIVPIKIIQPGWGQSGFYSPALLERDGAKAFPRGTQMFWDHPTESEERERPERSLRDLAGELAEDAHWREDGPGGPGLYSKAAVFGGFKDSLAELAPYIGLSINASGKAEAGEAGGRKGPIIKEITGARSVDFVTVPGAGGRILQLFEAARGKPPQENVQEADMAEEKALKEAQDALAAATKAKADLETENARLKEVLLLGEAKAFVSGKLAEQEMPDLTKTRLLEGLSKNPIVKDGKLDEPAMDKAITEAIKTEIEYLSKVTSSGAIQGLGESGQQETEGDPKKLEEAFVSLFESKGDTHEQAVKLAHEAMSRR